MSEATGPHQISSRSGPSLERSFGGHSRPVAAVAFHSNSKQLISGSLDGTVIVHPLLQQQARPIRFTGHKEAVYCLAFNGAQSTVASGSRDTTIRLWQPTVLGTKEGKASVLRGHHGPVRSVAFSLDGTYLLTTSDDKIAKVWSLPEQQCIATLAGHSNWIRCGQLSSDGGAAVTGSDDRSLKLWDTTARRCTLSFSSNEAGINAVALLENEVQFAAGCSDGQIHIWDTRAPTASSALQDHTASVTSVAVHPRDNCLLSSSFDGSLKLWDLRRCIPLFTCRGHEGAVLAAVFSQNGKCIASGGADQRVLLWQTLSGAVATQSASKRGALPAKPSLPHQKTGRATGKLHMTANGVDKSASSLRPATQVSRHMSDGNAASSIPSATAIGGTLSAEAWRGWPAVDMDCASQLTGSRLGSTLASDGICSVAVIRAPHRVDIPGRDPSCAANGGTTAESAWSGLAGSSNLEARALPPNQQVSPEGISSSSNKGYRALDPWEKVLQQLESMSASLSTLHKRMEKVEERMNAQV